MANQTQLPANTPATPPQVPANVPPAATAGKPAPAPTVPTTGKGATLNGITGPKGQPVTAQQVLAFVHKAAGGNINNVAIVPLANVAKGQPNPLPFANMAKPGKRATILASIVNGVPMGGGKGPSNTLGAFLTASIKYGASSKNPLDLLAALNGGYSASSKFYGTPYIKLVVTA